MLSLCKEIYQFYNVISHSHCSSEDFHNQWINPSFQNEYIRRITRPEAELWFIIRLLGPQIYRAGDLIWSKEARHPEVTVSIHPISKTLNIVYGSEFLANLTSQANLHLSM